MELGRGPLAGHSILVLEDEPLLALELNSTLSDAGASVYMAMDGETALRAIEVHGTSAAVLDMNLGREDCSSVCERLSDGGIPFVFFTGAARPDIMLRWPNTPVLTKLARKQRIIGVLAGLTIGAEHPGNLCN
jgi:CheY-like chemotaxis protein